MVSSKSWGPQLRAAWGLLGLDLFLPMNGLCLDQGTTYIVAEGEPLCSTMRSAASLGSVVFPGLLR